MGNLWDEDEMLDDYSRTLDADNYDTPKPPLILSRIIKMFSHPGDAVADFFMGGGTTVVQTILNHRKGIFCDISEKACEKTISKINNL